MNLKKKKNNFNDNKMNIAELNDNNSQVILEKPIENLKDDKFNIFPYVNQLKEACERGAVFIAVDGKYGSGKSSIVNLFENEVKNDMHVFVNINFMNINSIPEKETKDDDIGQENKKTSNRKEKLLVNDYHRYFVNQVINDICKDPYEFEKLFYNQKFTLASVSLKKRTEKEKKFKKCIDRLLLFLISMISIYTIYGSFFDNEENIYHNLYLNATKVFPFTLLITFVLILLYGYSFYKPDKIEQSPILDTDKCRNNFLKVINDYLLKNTTLYLIIDDLDRIKDNKLQLEIISLLFNEYYSLNNVVNNVKLKFIFMLDIEKMDSNDEIQPAKIFDYILHISSNQKIILKSYTEKLIQENKKLSKIFDIDNYEYFIGLIISKFKDMRQIKHLLNKILTKCIYIESKNIPCNYCQLVIICILTSIYSDEDVTNNIDCALNKIESNEVNSDLTEIIIENINFKVIDKNYYVYIYNFMDNKDLLQPIEEKVFDILVNTDFKNINEEKVKMLNELLNTSEIRFQKIYDECYKYIGNNKKIILLGNSAFYNYMRKNNLIDNRIFHNSYVNKYLYSFYKNGRCNITMQIRNDIIFSLIEKQKDYEENENKYNDFVLNFELFLQNLKHFILDFEIKSIISELTIDDRLFNLIFNVDNSSHSIIFDLIVNDYIEVNDICDKITKEQLRVLRKKDADLAFRVEQKLINSKIESEFKLDILLNEEKKFTEIEKIYNEFISLNISISNTDLVELMNKYGYNLLLDDYIIKNIKSETLRFSVIKCIRENQYSLSKNVLIALNDIDEKYGYNEYYENLFKKEKFYELLIFSQAINTRKFKIDITLKNNSDYDSAILRVYEKMGDTFKDFIFTTGFLKKIINSMESININFNNNFWKIDILIDLLTSYDVCVYIFDKLNNDEIISKFINYCKTTNNKKYYKLLDYLSMYSSEMAPSIKGLITKAKNRLSYQKNK